MEAPTARVILEVAAQVSLIMRTQPTIEFDQLVEYSSVRILPTVTQRYIYDDFCSSFDFMFGVLP